MLVYAIAFIIIMSVASFVTFRIVNDIISRNIEKELEIEATLIKDMILTATDTSIRNHLRTTAENNLATTEYYYNQYLDGP